MATSGLDKFNKYFRGKGEIDVIAKASGGKEVSVFDSLLGNKKIATIKDGTPITVVVGTSFQKRYFIKYPGGMGYISDSNVGKPIPSKSKLNADFARINAGSFINGGKKTEFKFIENDIKCIEFSNARNLSDSIYDGLNKNRGISSEILYSLDKFLKSPKQGKFEWESDVSIEERNRLGVYLGELFIGLYALSGNHSPHISPIPWKGNIGRFLIPTDPSFSGVDSFIEMEDGEIIPISSKFAGGAAASFFSNLLIKGIEHHRELPKSIFKDIVETAISIGVTKLHLQRKQKAKPILYEYGIRNVLNLDKRSVRDTYEVFTDIKQNRSSDEKNLVISKIASLSHVEQKIVDALDDSVTAFFCREISDMLNKDRASMDVMKEILSGKNYWQANLDQNSWNNGHVKYRMVNSGSAKLTLIGNKAAIRDIDASQGMINYRLTF